MADALVSPPVAITAGVAALALLAVASRQVRKDTRPSLVPLMAASVAACVLGLELGAFLVTVETEASGITALPMSTFLMFMLPIHLVIGLGEGLATGAVLSFVGASRPDLLVPKVCGVRPGARDGKRLWPVLAWFGGAALVLAICYVWIASGDPDGLEWSVAKVAGNVDLGSLAPPTAIMPDYQNSFSGIVGATLLIVLLWALTSLLSRHTGRRQPVAEKVRHTDKP